MKLSVSLPEEDVEFLDAYAEAQGIASRSAAMHKAVQLLRASELGPAYEDAWTKWANGDDQDLWENSTSDGLG